MIAERTFAAMGGTLEVQLPDSPPGQVGAVAALFASYEQTMSRFRADSELTALNASAPAPFRASPVLFDAVSQALAWACVTDGVFDPTMLDALEASGYDRPFDIVERHQQARPRQRHRTMRWRDIELDHERQVISMPEGVRIDLGGIGKGYTVDAAIALLGLRPNALVNASGDLFAAGPGPDGDGWYVGVQHPLRAQQDVATLRLSGRAVATSGVTHRHWSAGGEERHHLLDPRTGECTRNGVVSATVLARTATEADVLAKCICILGAAAGLRFLARFDGCEALVVKDDGGIVTSPGWKEYEA